MTNNETMDDILMQLDRIQSSLTHLEHQIAQHDERVATTAAEILDAERRRDLNESRAGLRASR